jgi:succinate dehydrogenase / fumarate reductase cytochrome b subunit
MSIANRPLSPHLEVYQPQLTSLMSIFNRLTGIFLSIGSVFLVWELLAAASGPGDFATFQWLAGSWLGVAALLGWSLAFVYHLLNGIRHLLWDIGWGFELSQTYFSGQAVIVGTLVLTLITWAAALILWGGV